MLTMILNNPSRIKIQDHAAIPATPSISAIPLANIPPRRRCMISKLLKSGRSAELLLTKRSCQRRRRKEHRHSKSTFMPRIPLRNIIIHARKQPTFKHAQKHPCRHQARIVLHKALANHTCRPEEHDEGKPNGGACALHHDVRRDLGGDVEGKKNS